MKKLSSSMNNYIAEKALAMQKNNKDVSLQSLSETVYERLYRGDKNTIAEFLMYDSGLGENSSLNMNFTKTEEAPKVDNKESPKINNNINTSLDEGDSLSGNVPVPKKEITYTVTREGGKAGLVINGKFNSWEDIEKADAVKDLPEKQQKLFSVWKATQQPIELTGNEAG